MYSYICFVAGASLKSAEILNNKDANTVINFYGGWHHAHRYFLYLLSVSLCDILLSRNTITIMILKQVYKLDLPLKRHKFAE